MGQPFRGRAAGGVETPAAGLLTAAEVAGVVALGAVGVGAAAAAGAEFEVRDSGV